MLELKNFIDLDENEQKMVLQWRNDPNIKKWMVSQEIISLEDHMKFIKNLSYNKNTLWFLVKKDNQPIGVINLKENEIGLFKNPSLQGVGTDLLKAIIDYGLKLYDTLRLEVFNTNTKAITLYKKHGFRITKEENGKIYMELKDENRKL
ncbi:MAG: UDP-4-amino-4,6-dideoxy-N-acetyl-beta-L-altrosamine N-acetyltransferase [Epsilonproteobacteria bacterium]|nr:UDP-4-amino-4,6-dideoxy-N-acetyl-beta-L-altrosamine N-acetyltransferase [Campylobacterota bacterium]